MIKWSMRLRSIDEWHGEDDLEHYAFHDSEVKKIKEMLMDAVKMKNLEDKFSPGDKWFFIGIKNMYWSEDD